jgi:hypothetical protein
MLTKKTIILCVMVLACIFLFKSDGLYSADNTYSTNIDYQLIEVNSITRYNEDRVAFQHIQMPGSTSYKQDNSIANLLIVRNNQIYLFRDGYDDVKKIQMEGYIQEMRRELPKDLWINRINSKPDYVRISDRRTEKMLNIKEDYVDKNFGDFYRTVRNSFIQKHVIAFRNLLRDRIESDAHLVRKPISPPAFQEVKEPSKFSTTVTAKAIDGAIYYAEDSDGDDVTETLAVSFDDGFNWGFKSGPNIIFIFNNKEEDIKQLIGKICYEAYYGTSEEETLLLKTFPKESDIIEAFKLEKVTLQASQAPKPAAGGTTTK